MQIMSGPIFATDLCYSWLTKEFIEAGSDEWDDITPEDASDAVYVIRKPKHEIAPGQASRSYRIERSKAI